jgi:Zn-dependent protease with chaperone function
MNATNAGTIAAALVWVLMAPPMSLLSAARFVTANIVLVILFRRSYHWRSIVLLVILGAMVFQSLELVVLGLDLGLLEFQQRAFLPAALGLPSYLPILSDVSLGSATLGAIAAALVAVRIYFGKSPLEMLRALPGGTLVENPIWLRETVSDLADRANTRCPEVCLVDSGTPLAFTERMRRMYVIALSVGILECFESMEVEACMAHEVAHVKNDDFTVRFLATLCKVAVFFKPASYLIEAAIYRDVEFQADKTAASLVGGPGALISVLTKLGEFNSRFSTPTAVSPARAYLLDRAEGVLRIFEKHPSLESRIKALCQPSSADCLEDLRV